MSNAPMAKAIATSSTICVRFISAVLRCKFSTIRVVSFMLFQEARFQKHGFVLKTVGNY